MSDSEKDSQISGSGRARKAAGSAAAALIQSGQVVGLGTGDTAAQFINALGERVQRGEVSGLRCVATSLRSAELGKKLGLSVLELDAFDLGPDASARPIDITVDGADEIDGELRLVKGAGGALLFEKLVARASQQLVIIADPGKLVKKLGEKRPLPVEVVAFGARHTLARLRNIAGVLAADLRTRADKSDLYVTDGGNRIVDVKLDAAAIDVQALHAAMKALPGVIETGFFLREATQAILGDSDGRVEIRQRG